jgi:hypothetical protein
MELYSPARLQVDLELDETVKDDRGTDELVTTAMRIVGQIGPRPYGKGVGDTYHTGGGSQLRAQDSTIRLVALPRCHNVFRAHAEVPTVRPIEQATKHGL